MARRPRSPLVTVLLVPWEILKGIGHVLGWILSIPRWFWNLLD